MTIDDGLNWYYFECVRCGQTLRATVKNPSSLCGKCGSNIYHEISKVQYNAANGRFEIPK